jgi:hypothetical protein
LGPADLSPPRTLAFVERDLDDGVFEHHWGVAIGDFNRDGHADLAVTALSGLGLAVFLNLGEGPGGAGGEFGAPVLYSTGLQPRTIQSVDFDGDGLLDLVVGGRDGPNVWIFVGVGDGTFRGPTYFQMPGGVEQASALDLDGDGTLDIVATAQSGHAISIRPGRRGQPVSDLIAVPIAGDGSYLTPFDCNEDGRIDLATSLFRDGKLTVISNAGGFAFNAAGTWDVGTLPFEAAAGDLDGDGHADLVVTVQGDNALRLLLGNGDCTFRPAPADRAATLTGVPGPMITAVADLDGDATLDVIAPYAPTVSGDGAEVNGGIRIFRGLGGARFEVAYEHSTGSPGMVAIGDLDGDGAPDIAVANYSGPALQLFLSAGAR